MEILIRFMGIFNRNKRPKYLDFAKYWHQKVFVKKENDREVYFRSFCENKKVLHFGCTDWPIFNPKNNLHIKLNEYTKTLHGFDIDKDGIKQLKTYVNDKYFSSVNELVGESYDVCLIPETIEHVDNVKDFLQSLSKVSADVFLITGPNCFSKAHIERNFYAKDYFIEVVHPDHNCWYSPFTLKNQIEKYSDLSVKEVTLLEDEQMICCVAEF